MAALACATVLRGRGREVACCSHAWPESEAVEVMLLKSICIEQMSVDKGTNAKSRMYPFQ